MTTRKKWRVVYPGHPRELDSFKSEKATYEHVDALRNTWVAGEPTGSLTVQVNAGHEWQPYDHIDFAEEAP